LSLSAAAAKLPGPKQRWIHLQSPNFTFFSHLGESATRSIAADLEELRAVLATHSSLELASPVPTYIYVFRNDRDFTPYKRLHLGQTPDISGYFIHRGDANYIAINGKSTAHDWMKGNTRGDATAIVYHEYVHYFVANNLRGLPLWFEEGLAELYATFRVSGNKFQLGFADPFALALLKNSKLIPLADLLAVDHDSPLYNENDRKRLFYAQAWATAHYLLVGSAERRAQTPAFIEMVTSGVPQVEAMVRAYQSDLSTLEKEVQGYVRSPAFSYLEASATVDVDLPVTVGPISHADLLYRLGDLLAAQSSDRTEAVDHFEAAIRVAPDHGLALSALGLVAENQARWEDARLHYTRALAASPDEFTVQYRAGAFLLRRGSDPERARAALSRATVLAPEYGPAWEGLALAYQLMGDFGPEAIEAAETAHSLAPSNRAIASNLLRLYIASGDRAAAVDLVRSGFIQNSTDLRRAWSMILNDDLARARQLVARGDHRAAASILDEAQRHVDATTHPATFITRIEALRSDIRTIRIDRGYKQAVHMYNQGDAGGARQILLDLQTQIPDGRQQQAIQSLIDLIDRPDDGQRKEVRITTVSGITPEDIDELNRLLADRDLADARDFLLSLEERALVEEFEWIDARLAEIDTIVSYNNFVDQFNRAVDLFNAHAYADAIAILEELLATQPDAYGSDDARQLLDEARAAMGEK
jgi:tetratricopeptide (TPR) repeat protein